MDEGGYVPDWRLLDSRTLQLAQRVVGRVLIDHRHHLRDCLRGHCLYGRWIVAGDRAKRHVHGRRITAAHVVQFVVRRDVEGTANFDMFRAMFTDEISTAIAHAAVGFAGDALVAAKRACNSRHKRTKQATTATGCTEQQVAQRLDKHLLQCDSQQPVDYRVGHVSKRITERTNALDRVKQSAL